MVAWVLIGVAVVVLAIAAREVLGIRVWRRRVRGAAVEEELDRG